jgi:hypothetical protein
MITAYQGTADLARAPRGQPLCTWRCKPLRGFGGVTARLCCAKDGRHALQGIPYTLRS